MNISPDDHLKVPEQPDECKLPEGDHQARSGLPFRDFANGQEYSSRAEQLSIRDRRGAAGPLRIADPQEVLQHAETLPVKRGLLSRWFRSTKTATNNRQEEVASQSQPAPHAQRADNAGTNGIANRAKAATSKTSDNDVVSVTPSSKVDDISLEELTPKERRPRSPQEAERQPVEDNGEDGLCGFLRECCDCLRDCKSFLIGLAIVITIFVMLGTAGSGAPAGPAGNGTEQVNATASQSPTFLR